jgi:predicted nucleic acid-binding protein
LIRVVNTGPIIFLAKIDRLDLLRLNATRIVVPEAVVTEVEARVDVASAKLNEILDDWLERQSLDNPSQASLIPDLGPGEVEVILLAKQLGTVDVVLDDLDARRSARRMGLAPIGTLGLLLAGKRAGKVTSVREEMERLIANGFHLSDEVVTRILHAAGERP